MPWNFRMLEIGDITAKAMEPMWTGAQGVDQTVAAAMGPMQALLDQPRAGK